ncbi:MAG: N-acetylmuramoyl-L-alanine amidase [Clostridiales bacterium]|jgi:N-acetylmuramoyl-L-alanine amidase|nr:N-acetylmuramoyl-L-alanine amidase [Clostridiales bacterium]
MNRKIFFLRLVGLAVAAAIFGSCFTSALAASGEIEDESMESSISLLPSLSEFGTNLARDVSEQMLTSENNPRASINQLILPADETTHEYVIKAESPITRVSKQLLDDNRLVLDFHNSIWGLDEVYQLSDPVISRIRTGKMNDDEGELTRVVFDLKKGVSYSVGMSADRRSVTVRIERNVITSVKFRPEGNADAIVIEGRYIPVLSVFPLSSPERIVIDIPIAVMGLSATYMTASQMKHVRSVTTEQLDNDTARITLKMNRVVSIKAEYEGTSAKLLLEAASYKNIYYDSDNKTISIRKDSGSLISSSSTSMDDKYNEYRCTFTLSSDLSFWLGYGELVANDSLLKSISISQSQSGKTQLVFQEKQVLAFSMTEDNEFLYIKAMAPKEKYPKIVVIDPGHGASDPGARANGLVEKDLNLDVSRRLMQLIEADGKIKAYATRTTDVKPDLYDRPAWANKIGDLFVSIHMNAMGSNNVAANGTEVYYYPHSNDSQLGFSSREFASIMQSSLLNGLGSYDRKIHSNRFVVIRYTTIPAVLCEIGFLTNAAEAAKLATEEYRQMSAQSLYNGILRAFESYTPKR